MTHIIKISLLVLIVLTILVGSASAVSYSDADEDGICEPCEIITFYGDPGFDYYDWDFDNDGLPDDNGEVVTFIFENEGEYLVTVIESGGNTIQITIIVSIENEDDHENKHKNNADCKFRNKIEKILDRKLPEHVSNEIISKLLQKEFKKKFGFELDELDIDLLHNNIDHYLYD